MEECQVCVSASHTIKPCPFCDFKCCKSCLKRYLLEIQEDPKCMNCGKAYNREILLSLLPKTWLNKELKEHRESCLFEREVAMLPSTQPHVKREVERRNHAKRVAKLKEELERGRKYVMDKSREYQSARYDLMRLTNTPIPSEGEASAFMHRCSHLGCKGWLSTQYKCSVCERYTCPDCNGPKWEGRTRHVCDPEAVSSFSLIKKDSRKCPTCGIYIYKIDGCDQMFCTSCLKPFSWRTGRVLTTTIHNPHYFEAMERGMIRDPGDIPCGGLPTPSELRSTAGKECAFPLRVLRFVHHVQQVEMHRYPLEPPYDLNLSLRVRYSLSELSEDEFKSKLQRVEKDTEKKRAFGEVLQMLDHTLTDELRSLVLSQEPNVNEFKEKVGKLVDYGNDAFLGICNRYSCIGIRVILETMTIVTVSYKRSTRSSCPPS